jgi:hypothetical protein
VIIQRRDITLERWFGARVGNAVDASDDQPTSEATADA